MMQRNDSFPVIDSAVVSDAALIAQTEKECFSSPWSEEQVVGEISNPSSVFITAKIGGELCGYVSGRNVCGELYISNIAVKFPYRNRGIGSLLLCGLAERAKLLGCAFMTLEVRESNSAARRLYEKSGFECLGRRKSFYSAPAEDAYIYTLYF